MYVLIKDGGISHTPYFNGCLVTTAEARARMSNYTTDLHGCSYWYKPLS